MTVVLLRRDLDDLVLRLKGLIAVRALLARRGASASELAAHSDEIARVRDELARRAKELGDRAA
jgi:hypothetical protein